MLNSSPLNTLRLNDTPRVLSVTVVPGSATVGVGGTTALGASVAVTGGLPRGVTWSTSNAAIATVSALGVVTGVALGSVTVTATSSRGAKTGTAAITVGAGGAVAVRVFRLDTHWKVSRRRR